MCSTIELIEMNQLLIKLIYVKMSYNDHIEESEKIFQILKTYEIDFYHFDCQVLLEIFSKQTLDNLFTLICNSPSSELNLSMLSIICFYYEIINNNESIFKKVFNIIDALESIQFMYNFLKAIFVKYKKLLRELCDKNLLGILVKINVSNIETLHKCVMLCIENTREINTETLTTLSLFVSKSESCHLSYNEIFLQLISASSMTSVLILESLKSQIMWQAIFTNLVSVHPINRKRAMYWLNRYINGLLGNNVEKLSVTISNESVLFTLTPDIISDTVNLIDSLEEKQTHLIVPTLGKMETLKASYDTGLISVHWLMIIIEKASLHESSLILKWAFCQFLNVPVHFSSQSYCRMLSNFLTKTINQSNLYFSPDGVSDNHGFFAHVELRDFLHNLFLQFCQSSLSSATVETVFRSVFQSISSTSWNAQALLFFAESFYHCQQLSPSLPPLPFWTLSEIGKLCQSNLPTIDLKYRRFITSFLLVGFFKNYQIDIFCFPELVRVFQTFFDVENVVLCDCQLFLVLDAKIQSQSRRDRESIFDILRQSFDDIDLSDSNFTNKMASMAFFLSFFQIEMGFIDFIDGITKLICDSTNNPYARVVSILKSIVLVKHLCVLFSARQSVTDSSWSDSFDRQLDLCIGPIMRFLSNQIDITTDGDCQQSCLDLMRYFIVQFPRKIVSSIYPAEMNNADTTLSNVIGANIDSRFQPNFNGKFSSAAAKMCWLTKCHKLSPLDYERLLWRSSNINLWIIEFIEDDQAQTRLFSFYSDLLDVSPSSCQALVPILNIIGRSIGQILSNMKSAQHITMMMKLVSSAWNRVLELLSIAQKFWKVYSVFLERIFFHALLHGAHLTSMIDSDVSRRIVSCLNEIVESILEIGENKFGMVHKLGDGLHDFIVGNRFPLDGGDLEKFYLNLIGQLVLFGPCHRRSLRFEKRVERYLCRRYQDQWTNTETKTIMAESSDRVSAILILCLAADDGSVVTNEFRRKIIERLRDTDRLLLSTNKNRYKNYINNQLHRTRHRLYSVVLIVLKMSLNDNDSDHLWQSIVEEWMLDSISRETLSSIRHLSEWCLILIFSRDTFRQSRLVELLKSPNDSKPAYQCSLITIIRHLVSLNGSGETGMGEDVMIDQSILAILALGSAQNYNVRLHAMSFMKTIRSSKSFQILKPYLVDIIDGYISFTSQNSSGRNINKLCDNFWWSIFRPLQDVCLETVFDILPKLFDLVEEEIITIDQFKVVSKSSTENYAIAFHNQRPEWKGCHDSVWRVKTETTTDQAKEKTMKVDNDNEDVQKKIQPWLTSRPDEEALKALFGIENSTDSDIVLVCSLLDKPTNVGGLARTSNVFGIGEFVVDNLRVVDNNDFKQLAVTADKWINMTEVPAQSLVAFIEMKRAEGFDIVGIEQTANSVPLQKNSFKRKTVLILGNEREGIPVELISHLDKCIEIPQFGQIRSLNVHVTGAIVVWEYIKQMKLSDIHLG